MNSLKKFDKKYYSDQIKVVAGVDEAGRGPLAGPVVAAAVIFKKEVFIEGVDDSKKLTEIKREKLEKEIKDKCICFGIGIVDQYIIDEINILQATLKAMKDAVSQLSVKSDLVLIDGNKSFISEIPTKTIVKGDSNSFSIAAASILAKVARDNIMKEFALLHPEYLWERNKGYGTKQHVEALKMYGYTKYHRKTFLKKILGEEIQEELL